jgi:hypothetical protein
MKADGSILPWPVPANQLLSQSQINNGLYLHDGQYAFGTIQNGVIVINKNGQVIQHINKTMVSKTIQHLVLSRTIRRISGWDLIMV